MILGRLYHGLRVEVSRFLPYESVDPERPGTVHAVRVSGAAFGTEDTLLVSAELLERVKTETFRAKSRAWFRRGTVDGPLSGLVEGRNG